MKMPSNVKDLFQYQHRLPKLLTQSLRVCSSRTQAKLQAVTVDELDVKSQPIEGQPGLGSCWHTEPIEHDADVGRMFKASELSFRLAARTQLRNKPERFENLKFGQNFTDHMMRVQYSAKEGGWLYPEVTPLEDIAIHPAAKVFHYAVELFEGMKAYRGVDGRIRIFRPNLNMTRMNLTAKRCGLPTFEGSELIDCIARLIDIDSEWVPHKGAGSLYIRPTMIGTDPTLGVASSGSALLFTILSPVGNYFKADSTGAISLLADPKYVRAWPGGVGDRKMGSNYGPTIHVQNQAAKRGLQQVLWLYGEEQQITEVGTMNIFMFYINELGERELLTPPLNGLILPGIIRDSILHLTREWRQFKVREATFTMPQLRRLIRQERVLELFGTGTACAVTPVNRIEYDTESLYIPTMEQPNPIFAQLRDVLTDIQHGIIEHPWATVID